MRKLLTLLTALFIVSGCTNGDQTMQDRSTQPCANNPNCVSTQDSREKFSLAPFTLQSGATIEAIETVALSLGRAETATKQSDYLRIEFTSKVFRFVDDLELRIEGNNLIVRSESRTGRSDFGVNRKRVDALRKALKDANLI
ncbi:hypothetical protein A9264_07750 [Vibrio sp. UCD-FRSSP16_10]|uniref:DUF1499 domain-containing protein n=1 Tax=unclassified Vibrio TaxID=2614977 RepID=UPI0007FFDC9D|nr:MULTISPECIES: DUF1499 domain-containing protein [unclassified Vibrio]OBT07389.1 hypothetical protein A9260_08535 [Vibrio sp. UCD-FRSSP16_30]OBT12870.1 hypothetical protein A9264_07750 [Vibrio sp. UCD-FRSSP16_10]